MGMWNNIKIKVAKNEIKSQWEHMELLREGLSLFREDIRNSELSGIDPEDLNGLRNCLAGMEASREIVRHMVYEIRQLES